MGFGTLSDIKVYRNIYVKGYKKFPYQKLTGRNCLVYSGEIILGVEELPDEYDKKKDLYMNCECDFSKYRNIYKLKLKTKSRHV